MTDPITALHYTANGNFLNGVYAPGADGFNLADVGSVSELNALPPGVKGLVYLGLTSGAGANFQATVSAFIGNPNLYGFYIADEPGPGLAANLKAESGLDSRQRSRRQDVHGRTEHERRHQPDLYLLSRQHKH